MWRHIDVQADWRSSWTYGRALNAIRHFVRFFNVPVQAPTHHPNKSPFTTRWEYGGHFLDLTPPGGTPEGEGVGKVRLLFYAVSATMAL